MKDILIELDMNFNDFKTICVISGTDYNINNSNDLSRTLKYFKKYRKSKQKSSILQCIKSSMELFSIYLLHYINAWRL